MSTPRIKDASFLQQHIEKLVLAVGLLVLLIAVFLFVMGNPFAVKVNGQAQNSPQDAVDFLDRTNTRIKNGLADSKPLPVVITPDFSAAFLETLNRDIDLDRLVEGMGDPGITLGGVYPDIPKPSRYTLAYPPVPKNIKNKYGTDVLDKEFDPEAAEAFFKLWDKQPDEPGDFTMFVASGDFDIWEWVQRLKAEPTGDEEIKIPGGIWAQRFGIAGVVLLREEFDPVQGRWVNRQYVEALPGQMRVLPDMKAESEINQAIAQLTELRNAQVELAQPDLPYLADLGEGYDRVTPPGDEGDDAADGLLQALDDENLGKAEKDILKLEDKIKDLEERQAKRNQRSGGAEDPGAASERRDPFAKQIADLRARIEKLRPRAQKEAENRKRLAEAQRQREEERRRREALRDQNDRLVGDPGDDPLGLAGVPGMQLEQGSTLRVWAADPSMQPGMTYRYKLLVSVINPLYAVPRLAPDQLEANQNRAALLPTESEIDAMPWVGPIKVEPRSQFFFTSGRNASARVEIYRRHEGILRKQDFDGSPGDSIGGVLEIENGLGQIVEIDMGVGSVLVDVEQRRDLLSNRTVYAMIYMDAEGRIFERIDDFDKSSPALKELQIELKEGPKNALRPDPEAEPDSGFGPGEFGPGEFGPDF